MVWYAVPLTTRTGSCLLTVGTEEGRDLRSFTKGAPVLMVDVGKTSIQMSNNALSHMPSIRSNASVTRVCSNST